MEKLNPWTIEVDYHGRESIRINIVNYHTGEIRQTTLTVDDINNICMLGTRRVEAIADYIYNIDEEEPDQLDELIGYVETDKEDMEIV